MKKAMIVNSGSATIFKYPPEIFDACDLIILNSGRITLSGRANAELNKKQLICNSGNTRVVDIPLLYTLLPANHVITDESRYDGQFLVCEGNLWIETTNAAVLEGVLGVYAPKVYHPESFSIESIPNLTATTAAYPDGAQLCKKPVTLDIGSFRQFREGLVWINGEFTALEGALLEKAKQKGIRFAAKSVLMHESSWADHEDLFDCQEVTLIPDGHEVVDDIQFDASTSVLYGTKLYVRESFTMQHDYAAALDDMESIIVCENARLPIGAVAKFRSIGKANTYEAYEGTLWECSGTGAVNHAQLAAMCEKGQSSTLYISGTFAFEEDVTADDLSCLHAINYSGVISVPDSIKAAVQALTKNSSGLMISTSDELNGLIPELAKKVMAQYDISLEDIQLVNVGSYNVI